MIVKITLMTICTVCGIQYMQTQIHLHVIELTCWLTYLSLSHKQINQYVAHQHFSRISIHDQDSVTITNGLKGLNVHYLSQQKLSQGVH